MDITLEEKALIVARHIPCDHCSCQGWRSSSPSCTHPEKEQTRLNVDNCICDCGHQLLEHVDHWRNIDRRVQLAIRIKDILKENGKENDSNYTNDTIQTLQRQILENAPAEGFLPKDIPLYELDGDDDPCAKRDREGVMDSRNVTKRQRTDVGDHCGSSKGTDPANALQANDNEDNGCGGKSNNANDDTNSIIDTTSVSIQQNQLQLNSSIENIPGNATSSSPSVDVPTKKNFLNNVATVADDHIQKGDIDGSTKLLENQMGLDKKEPLAMMGEERKGDMVTKVILNDGKPENMIFLTALKNIFQKQLPMMPKEYITRLVYDRNHRCVALIRRPLKVIGGICYRPFDEQDFAEIVFCAISSTEQVRGYGAHIMNYLKDYIITHTDMRHFLTYADNYATGYFKKQGFTTDITLDRRKWVGFIKDYEGGTIMQCTVDPGVNYSQAQNNLEVQQQQQQQQIGQVSALSELEMSMDDDPLLVPGVREPIQSSYMGLSTGTKHPPQQLQMQQLVSELQNHGSSWPFRKPVNGDQVADYYQVIRNPMDLATLEQNVNGYVYTTMDEFVTDAQKIFDNCRTYNPEGTNYAKCATILEQYFYERLRLCS